MEVSALADTGALLAYLDRRDPWHERCLDVFARFRLPLSTSSAVLTGLFHLLGDTGREVEFASAVIRSGALTVLPISDADLPNIEALMRKYRDRPMDFADATLVRIAERESLTLILTIDHNDFETYRIQGRRRFRIVPARD